jgi:flagellar basal body P-ring formation protein FlgA
MRPLFYMALALASLFPTDTRAEERQSLPAIAAAVRAHLAAGAGPDTEITVARLDPRLRLPACTETLALDDSRAGQGRPAAAVEVRCEGDKPWALYVPVTLRRYAEVLVAARPLARGTVLAAEDVRLARTLVGASGEDHFRAPAEALGRITGRALAAGEPLLAAQLRRARLIRRGAQVRITSAGANISISVAGTALEDGGAGDRVRVRNLSSARVVEGVVQTDGAVRIAGPLGG